MKPLTHSALFVVLLFIGSLAQAAVFYVHSIRAPILAGPSFGSSRVAVVSRGTALKELEKKGSWYKVDYKNKTGWISRFLIGTKPPAGRISVLEGTTERLDTGARRRASAFTTAAAARGFAEDRSRVSNKYMVNFRGVERMENIKVNDDEAVAFLLEGVGK